jgi:predicted nucleotidyltransferase
VDTVLLYGSRAKGTFKDGSDIDLTLKGSGLNLTVLNRIDNELDDLLLPWSFDLSLYAQIQSPELIEHIDRVGIDFYMRKTD